MFEVIEFNKIGRDPLFTCDEDRRYFLRLARRLGDRWGVRVQAFRLGIKWAAFLVEGDSEGRNNWSRLVQSGYGVWRYHQHDPMTWSPLVRVPLPGEARAWEAVSRLHQGLEPDPLAAEWSSLRDGVGLRRAMWFDASWLSSRGALALYQGAGGRERLPTPGAIERCEVGWMQLPERDPWKLIGAAVGASTGMDPEHRSVRGLRMQVGWARGWSLRELARLMGVQPTAVRRMLRRERVMESQRALLHLEDPRLRISLGKSAAGVVKGWDLPEPPWSRLHSFSNKPALSSPAV